MTLGAPSGLRPLDHRASLALVVYTAVVWLGRVRNVLADDDLSGSSKLWRLLTVLVFLGLAAAVVAMWPNRRLVLGVLCAWTVVFWVVRGSSILVGSEGAGFKAVHTVLAAASIGLALWAWPGRRPGVR